MMVFVVLVATQPLFLLFSTVQAASDAVIALQLHVYLVLPQRIVCSCPLWTRQASWVLCRGVSVSTAPGSTPHPGADQVEHLKDVEDQRDAGHHQHEDDEDGLLCGSGHVTLHGEGTGLLGAGEHGDHDETVQVVLSHDESGLDEDLDHKLGQVAPQQVPLDLDMSPFITVLGLFEIPGTIGAGQQLPQLVLLVDDMHGMTQVDQRRRGDEDDLQDPETDVGDGERPVVADVLATGLLSVADETGLLVAPDALSTRSQNQDSEQEEHTHPDLPDHRGMGLDFFQQVR